MNIDKQLFKDCFNRWLTLYKRLNSLMDEVAYFPCDEEEDFIGLYNTRLSENCNYFCLFVQEDGKDIAFLTYSEHHKHVDISDLYVEEEYRSKGIGEELINEVKKILSGRLMYVGTVGGNERAVEFYKRMGFEVLSYNLQLKG